MLGSPPSPPAPPLGDYISVLRRALKRRDTRAECPPPLSSLLFLLLLLLLLPLCGDPKVDWSPPRDAIYTGIEFLGNEIYIR